jgi:hypothetical protein
MGSHGAAWSQWYGTGYLLVAGYRVSNFHNEIQISPVVSVARQNAFVSVGNDYGLACAEQVEFVDGLLERSMQSGTCRQS